LLLLVTLAASLLAAQTAAPKLRLPDNARPLEYTVDLHIVPGEDRFQGTVRIEVELTRPSSVIWLHAQSMTFQKASVRAGSDVRSAKVQPPEGDFVAIDAGSELPKGNMTLEIDYSGEISRSLTDGVFQQRQGDDWYVFTKFEPVTARRAFPCFDEPGFKTPWQLTLHVPAALRAFSNTPAGAETGEADGMKAVRFQKTKPLPSYLVAFAAGPLEIVETEPVGTNRVPSRIIVPRGRQSETDHAREITPGLIASLESYYGTPYPYEKLDQIVVPLTTSWGAMENAGLIAYGDFLLAPKAEDTERRRRGRAETMLHEMSHQWFGDLVTTAWWDDIWLNEAFASWISRKLLDEAHPDWKLRTETASAVFAMRTDSLASARKIRQPIEAPGDIANAFDGITYVKGSDVIGMFENYVQPEVFRRAIQLYLKQHAWGNATSADLLSALDAVAGPGVGAAFATFLNQGGFPLVHVKLNCASTGAALDASQERFLPLGSEAQAGALWQTPLCVKWEDQRGIHTQCALMAKARESVSLRGGAGCPVWLFANRNGAGYYAASYDSALFESLTRQGLAKLSPPERASILRDVRLMFASGKTDARTALGAAREFSRDPDRIIVEQTESITYATSDFVPEDLRPNYARFVQALFGARARELGWKPKPGEDEETRLLRQSLVPFVADAGEDTALRSEAVGLARAWLADRHSLDPAMIDSVLSTAAYAGSRDYFEALVAAVQQTKVKREREYMIGALASFREPRLKQAALNLVFASEIDPRELTPVIFGIERETRDVVWTFVKEHFDQLNSRLPGARGIPFGAELPFAAGRYCDETHRADVEAFFQSRIASLSGGKRNLANVLERIRLCSVRAAAVAPGLADFLKPQ